MRIALAIGLTAALGVGFGAAGGGDAPLELAASMSPQTIHFPRTREVVYRLEIETGETAQRLRVAVQTPVYAPSEQPPPRTTRS